MRHFLCLLALAAACSGWSAAHAQTPSAEDTEFFETSIRPLLVQHCYECHSAESDVLQGGLHLDSREGWAAGGDSGAPAIVPGELEGSPFITAIRYADEQLQMPPAGKLADAEIALLEEWVRRGAPDPRSAVASAKPKRVIDLAAEGQHWAYQPLSDVSVPAVADEALWAQSDIDRFILAKQQAEGLFPNPKADRRTLIRRAYFDLTGLPPTPEEVAAFESDPDPQAFARLVERLLESPHYGERWARHWLDLARFAESHGYEQDYDRPYAYYFRDFVIQALNQDLPYNTFVQWQIAGDELAPNNPLALMATGYLGCGTHATQITMNQVEKERYDELDDIVSNIGTTMLGLTIGCARCHDHKYDPIPNTEYYRLLSTFTKTVRAEIDVDFEPDVYSAKLAEFEAAHAPLVAALAQYDASELPAALDSYLAAPPAAMEAKWLALDLASATSAGGATFRRLEDGSYLAEGANADFDTYTFTAQTYVQQITAVRIEALAHESLVGGGPGRAGNGNFDLTDVQISAAPASGETPPVALKLVAASATFEQAGLPAAATIDADAKSGWAVDPQFGKDHALVLEFESPVGFPSGTLLTCTLQFNGNNQHNIGRPRLSLTTAARPVSPDGERAPQAQCEIAGLWAACGGQPNDQQRAALVQLYKLIDPRRQELQAALDAHAAQRPQPTLKKVMVCSEGVPAIRWHTQGGDFLEETHFLERGDPNRKKGVATQGFLSVLLRAPQGESYWQSPPPAASHTSYQRTAFAQWLTDTQYGAGTLLARVIVNRVWQRHLGRGIVATTSDFGAVGEPPSHPELLDYLTREFIAHGWSLKWLHRTILASAVYQQSDASDEARLSVDVENKFFWRARPRRLEAEIIRDSILSVAGQLDETLYGPGTLDPQQRRRSIYFFVKRSQLIPMMMLFDAPDTLQGIAVRPTTTVAPQALLLMNNATIRGYAQAFAGRVASDVTVSSADDAALAAVVDRAYRLALARAAAPEESAAAVAFIQQQRASYASLGEEAALRTALTDFCQVVFDLNEFVYID